MDTAKDTIRKALEMARDYCNDDVTATTFEQLYNVDFDVDDIRKYIVVHLSDALSAIREAEAGEKLTDKEQAVVKEAQSLASLGGYVGVERLPALLAIIDRLVQPAKESKAGEIPGTSLRDRSRCGGGSKSLRSLVDVVWQTAMESEQVPATDWADRMIAHWNAGNTSGLPASADGVAGVSPATTTQEKPAQDKHSRGLYQKYIVTRTDGSSEPGKKHDGCEYFVLDITHDPFAIPALKAYAEACKKEYPALAQDLRHLTEAVEAFPPHDAPLPKPTSPGLAQKTAEVQTILEDLSRNPDCGVVATPVAETTPPASEAAKEPICTCSHHLNQHTTDGRHCFQCNCSGYRLRPDPGDVLYGACHFMPPSMPQEPVAEKPADINRVIGGPNAPHTIQPQLLDPAPTRNGFAEWCKSVRLSRNISQTELAKLTGLEPSAISHFECGRREPSFENFVKICEAVKPQGHELAKLFPWKDSPAPTQPPAPLTREEVEKIAEIKALEKIIAVFGITQGYPLPTARAMLATLKGGK